MSEQDKLPDGFDAVIIGTGVTESIVSAAVSRNGHSVLHLDPRDYYGGSWATHNFDTWASGDFAQEPTEEVLSGGTSVSSLSEEGHLKWTNTVRDLEQIYYTPEKEAFDLECRKNGRKFNIDLFPKLILAREEIVELLIKSNVSRYLEFLRVGKLLTSLPPPTQSVIQSIPLSRADIFTSKSVSLVEKRTLVKFIEAILKPLGKDSGETDGATLVKNEDEQSKDLEELANETKLSLNVRHLIEAAIKTIDDGFDISDRSFLKNTSVAKCKLFLESIGRFGNQTPYLWTLYGISEICQAFCRLSAVYGGLFILKRRISSLKFTDGGIRVVAQNDEFTAKYLVLGPDIHYIDQRNTVPARKVARSVGRGVLITEGGPLKLDESKPGSKSDGISLYKLGELEVIELNHLSQTVPKEYRLLQVTFPIMDQLPSKSIREKVEETLSQYVQFNSPSNPQDCASPTSKSDLNYVETERESPNLPELQPTGSNPLQQSRPRVLYGSYFLIDFYEDTLHSSDSSDLTKCIFSCSTGTTDITSHINKAERIFHQMYPDEEFLPKAPDVSEDAEEETEAEESIGNTEGNNSAVSGNKGEIVEYVKE